MKKFILGCLLVITTHFTFAVNTSLVIPMTIFGDIVSEQNMSGATLNIYNTDKFLLNSLKLSGNTYGSNDAFEIEKRVNLNEFENSLVFEILVGNKVFSNITASSTGNYNCSETPTFQTNKLCKYDLNLSNTTQTNIVNIGTIKNLQISNQKDTSLTLSWDTLQNIDGFVIINKNSNSQLKQTSNTYNFTDLLPNTTYNFQIYAYKGTITGEIKEITLKTPHTPKQIFAGTIEADSNTLSDLDSNEAVNIVVSDNLDEVKQTFHQISPLDTTNEVSVNITNSPITLDDTEFLQKRLIFLPQDRTQNIIFSLPAGVKPNNNGIIYPPVVIERKDDIKTKMETLNLKVNITSALQVPTSQSITFNGDIELCMPANGRSTLGNLVIYYSIDGNTWQKDMYAHALKISNNQICFKTNHLTSFASLEETIIVSQNSGSSGGGGGGSYTPNCLDTQLTCEKYLTGYVWKIKSGNSCQSINLGQTCSISENIIIPPKVGTPEKIKNTLNIKTEVLKKITLKNGILKITDEKLAKITDKIEKIILKKVRKNNITQVKKAYNNFIVSLLIFQITKTKESKNKAKTSVTELLQVLK